MRQSCGFQPFRSRGKACARFAHVGLEGIANATLSTLNCLEMLNTDIFIAKALWETLLAWRTDERVAVVHCKAEAEGPMRGGDLAKPYIIQNATDLTEPLHCGGEDIG